VGLSGRDAGQLFSGIDSTSFTLLVIAIKGLLAVYFGFTTFRIIFTA
jgi:hypothetical protein